MSLTFTAGDLSIHRIIEQETTFLPALEMLPGLTPECWRRTGHGCNRRVRSTRRTF
jgi:hypothetical protein